MPNTLTSGGRRRGAAACLGVALLLPTVAFAARPLVTDDAGVLDPDACELEAVGGRQREETSTTTAAAQLGCGVGARTQLTLAFTRSRETEEPATRAVNLSSKTSLGWWPDGPAEWALSMSLGREHALEGEQAELIATVVLIATVKASDRFTWHANVGWVNRRPARVNTTSWNLAGEYAVDPRVDLTAEVYGDDRQRPWVAGGVRLNLGPAWNLNASYGGQPTDPHARQLSIGAKFAF